MYDNKAIVLDIRELSKSKLNRANKGDFLEVLTYPHFVFLELAYNSQFKLSQLEIVDIGKDSRTKIQRVNGKLTYSSLTKPARAAINRIYDSIESQGEFFSILKTKEIEMKAEEVLAYKRLTHGKERLCAEILCRIFENIKMEKEASVAAVMQRIYAGKFFRASIDRGKNWQH